MNPATMAPGDRYMERDIVVTILRDREEYSHWLVGPGYRYWATRSDTGAEGFVEFGPGAADRIPA